MALRSTENEATLPTRARILLKNDAIAKKTTLFNKVGLYENVKTPQIRFLQLKFSRYCLIQRNKYQKMPLIATNPNPRVILGLMTFG
jgi:hypothetical protein